MIYEKTDYTLELTCDICNEKKVWKNKGEYPNFNMKGNEIEAKKEGWLINHNKHHCECPKCKNKGDKK